MIFLEIMSFFGIKIIYCPMRKGFWRDREEIFFVGIGGVSMSGLALCLKNMGFRVRGSDVQESARTAALRRAGIEVAIGQAFTPGERNAVIRYALSVGTRAKCASRSAIPAPCTKSAILR